MVALTCELVAHQTENPPGTTAGAAKTLGRRLTGSGFECEYLEPQPGVMSVVGRYAFDELGPAIMLCGHLDVVPVGDANDWTSDPWQGAVREGRLYGRGALDMKGPLAALVVAAEEAIAEDDLCGEIMIAAVADEETGGRLGAGALVEVPRFRADAVLIAEPSDGAVVIAHRGMCFVEVTTRGVAGHASTPTAGLNAVELMVDVLTSLRTLTLEFTPHPVVAEPSVAIGTTIAGGTKPNMIPDMCTATLDVRKVPGMTDASVLDDIDQHLRRAGFDEASFALRIIQSGEPAETPSSAEIVAVAQTSMSMEFGSSVPLEGSRGATDGWWFRNRAGTPTIMALGPGRIRDCHIVDESVGIDELERFARVYRHVLGEFLGGKNNAQVSRSSRARR